MKVRRVVLVLLCAISLVTVTSSLRGDDVQKKQHVIALEKQLDELLYDRVKTAERARDAIQAAYDAQTVTLFELLNAQHKLLEARLALTATPAEEIIAIEDHCESVKKTEEKVAVLYKIGARGGEAKEMASVTRERQTAEIALLKARLKSSR